MRAKPSAAHTPRSAHGTSSLPAPEARRRDCSRDRARRPWCDRSACCNRHSHVCVASVACGGWRAAVRGDRIRMEHVRRRYVHAADATVIYRYSARAWGGLSQTRRRDRQTSEGARRVAWCTWRAESGEFHARTRGTFARVSRAPLCTDAVCRARVHPHRYCMFRTPCRTPNTRSAVAPPSKPNRAQQHARLTLTTELMRKNQCAIRGSREAPRPAHAARMPPRDPPGVRLLRAQYIDTIVHMHVHRSPQTAQ